MNTNRLKSNNNVLYLLNTIFLVFFCSISIPAISQKTETDSIPLKICSFLDESSNQDSVLLFAETYLGTPYKMGGRSAKGFDCSGFVHHVYKQFNIKVPYSCPAISSACAKKIEKVELQKGDLLFFKGSNIKSKAIGHIAIVYSVDEDGIKMIHSCRRGVIIDKLNDSKYYKARYLFAKRIM